MKKGEMVVEVVKMVGMKFYKVRKVGMVALIRFPSCLLMKKCFELV